MIQIHRPSRDPYLNIATEEYVMKHMDEDVLMLWQSDASVILGKHQNAMAEVNLDYVNTHNIPVIRRISGGGTVYHGPGNINYSLIKNEKNSNRLIDFKRFSQPIIEFLSSLEITASFEGKNNLRIGDKKFSGNSAHVFKNRVMHHGTLLYNCDLEALDQAIKPPTALITDKAVQSVRASVCNITDYLDEDLGIDAFMEQLGLFLRDYFKIETIASLSKLAMEEISRNVAEKYGKWEWNYGYSPAYTYLKKEKTYSIELKVKQGIIDGAVLKGFKDNNAKIEEILLGIPHHKDFILSKFGQLKTDPESQTIILKLLGF